MADRFGGIPIAGQTQTDRFGGIPVAPTPTVDESKPVDKGFLGQLWEDISNLPAGMAHTVLHPIDSALSGIAEPALREYKKAKENILGTGEHATEDPRQRFGQAVLHGVASAIPVLGPLAAK